MSSIKSLISCFLGVFTLVACAPLVEREDLSCTHGPNTRSCWKDGHSIATNWDLKIPSGQERTYNLEITNTTWNPDGAYLKQAFLINNQYPGPSIVADWGDTLIINVKNSLPDNGTTIHWHGIRQLNSNLMDGANGVTECPIRPGETRQYKFRATQYGTTWYHSHFSAQYADGVVGTMVINGPASANYDEDLGVLPLTDWYYKPAFLMGEINMHSSGPPIAPDNLLVNGTHINANGTGKYFRMSVERGKKYRVRIINTSVDSFFHVSLDGHPFQVISADLVPVKPFYADQLAINIGQRYDVIITANQTSDIYWFRVNVGTKCTSNNMVKSGKVLGAIFGYNDAPNPESEPSSTGVTLQTNCDDETEIVPWLTTTVPKDQFSSIRRDITLEFTTGSENLVQWLINGTSMVVDWAYPTIQHVLDGSTDYGDQSNLIKMPNANQWYFWVIQSAGATAKLPHPIHLHGHDFWVLGKNPGSFNGTLADLNFSNPTRRDVATLPAGGYLVLAFPADNPGAWLMHCHIAWHASEGLSLQFLERKDEIEDAVGDTSSFLEGCEKWNEYWDGPHPWPMNDSGL